MTEECALHHLYRLHGNASALAAEHLNGRVGFAVRNHDTSYQRHTHQNTYTCTFEHGLVCLHPHLTTVLQATKQQTRSKIPVVGCIRTGPPTLTGGLEGDLAGLTGSQYDDPLDPRLGGQAGSGGQVTAGRRPDSQSTVRSYAPQVGRNGLERQAIRSQNKVTGNVPPGRQDVVGEGQLPVDELSLGVKVEGVTIVKVELAGGLPLQRTNSCTASSLKW